ncbi:MAG TPA: hypothetical protein PLH37_01615 [bacterium]|nr:hypothetical protein [bacterium]
MFKTWYVGGIALLVMAFLVAGAFGLSFHKNSVNAQEKAPVLTNTKASCGCGAKAACGGSCSAGQCQCGSACAMNRPVTQ